MISESVAFVAGFTGSLCRIYKTIDGGLTWYSDGTGFSTIYSLAMYDENLGVAGGVAGAGIYVSVAGTIDVTTCVINSNARLFNRSHQSANSTTI
jgi:hypothetical protein